MNVMINRGQVGITRREALRSALAASTFAAPLTLLAVEQADAYDAGRDESRSRYRETDHVKAFYRTNGYETLKK
jgi:hypothetical protein